MSQFDWFDCRYSVNFVEQKILTITTTICGTVSYVLVMFLSIFYWNQLLQTIINQKKKTFIFVSIPYCHTIYSIHSTMVYGLYTSNYMSEIYISLKADVNYICDVYIPRSNKSACLHTIYTHKIHTVALRNTIYLIPSNIWVTHSYEEEEILSSNLKCPLKQKSVLWWCVVCTSLI